MYRCKWISIRARHWTGCEDDFAFLVWLSRGKFFFLYKEIQSKALPACENQLPNLAENVIIKSPGCSCYSTPSLLNTVGPTSIYAPTLLSNRWILFSCLFSIVNSWYTFCSSKYGIYKPNCGLDKVTMSWGHDGMTVLYFRSVNSELWRDVYCLIILLTLSVNMP